MSEPTDPGLMAWLGDKAWYVIVALIGVVWRSNDAKHKTTREIAAAALEAHQLEDDRRFKALDSEQGTQRGHIAKIFDQLRDDALRAEARHRELMERTHDGHQQLLIALNSKQDK